MKAAKATVTLAAIIRKARCRYGSRPSEYETKSAPRAAAEPPNTACVAVPTASESSIPAAFRKAIRGAILLRLKEVRIVQSARQLLCSRLCGGLANVPVCIESTSFHVRSHHIARCWRFVPDAMRTPFNALPWPGMGSLACAAPSSPSFYQRNTQSAGAVLGLPVSGP